MVRMVKSLRTKTATLIIFLAAMLIVFSVVSGGAVLRARNIRNILQSVTIVSFLTIGAGIQMIGGYIDLSLGAIGTMCAIIAANFLRSGVPWYASVIIVLVIGGVVGLVNAFLVNEMRFQSFIATLGTASIVQGSGFLVSGGKGIDIYDPVFEFIGTKRFLDVIPYSVIISLIAVAIYAVIMNKTKFGRSVYLIGGNPDASRLSGLRPKRIIYILFINSGMLAALAGTLLAARLMVANTVGTTSSQFTGLTAAVLGGISFGGGSGGMGGAFIGILILSCFNNGMTVIDVPPYWQTVATGALLLIALTVDFLAAKKRSEY